MPFVIPTDPPINPFTFVTVTGSWANTGEAMSGTITFTLLQPVTNAGVTIPATPLVVNLDDTGSIDVQLPATDDDGTTPAGVWYGVTEQLIGAQPRDYFIKVSAAAAPSVELGELMPATLPWC